MTEFKIAVVVGSLRRDAMNRTLTLTIEKPASAHFSFTHLSIGGLPLYNQDDDAKPADSVKRLKAATSASQGLLFVTAKYNRSMPGVLKNAIDHASRTYGQSPWVGKLAGVPGASMGVSGTCTAQQHLRNMLTYLDVPTFEHPEAFNQMEDGLLDDSGAFAGSSRAFFQAWIHRYVARVEKDAG
jgi:chromate reductase